MAKIFLVDSENIGSLWSQLLPVVAEDDKMFVFYTDNSPYVSYEHLMQVIAYCKIPVFIKCHEGKNALDFQLVSELGFKLNQWPDAEFVIVSDDFGYDAVVRYWSEKKYSIRRIGKKYCRPMSFQRRGELLNQESFVQRGRDAQIKQSGAFEETDTQIQENDGHVDGAGQLSVAQIQFEDEIQSREEEIQGSAHQQEGRQSAETVQPQDERWSVEAAQPEDEQWSASATHSEDEQWSASATHSEDEQWSAEAAQSEDEQWSADTTQPEDEQRSVSAAQSEDELQVAEAAKSEGIAQPEGTAQSEETAQSMSNELPVQETTQIRGAIDQPVEEVSLVPQEESSGDALKAMAQEEQPNAESPKRERTSSRKRTQRNRRSAAQYTEVSMSVEAAEPVVESVQPVVENVGSEAITVSKPAVEATIQQKQAKKAARRDAGKEAKQDDQKDLFKQLLMIVKKCDSLQPDIDANSVYQLFCTMKMSNLTVVNTALKILIGNELGNDIYREIKEHHEYRSQLDALYYPVQKERFIHYVKIVLERNDKKIASVEEVSKFLLSIPRKNLNSIRSAMLKQFGRENGSEIYTMFKPHIKILNKI